MSLIDPICLIPFVPFILADLVLTPVLDTLLFPYDLTQYFMNKKGEPDKAPENVVTNAPSFQY